MFRSVFINEDGSTNFAGEPALKNDDSLIEWAMVQHTTDRRDTGRTKIVSIGGVPFMKIETDFCHRSSTFYVPVSGINRITVVEETSAREMIKSYCQCPSCSDARDRKRSAARTHS